MKASLAALALQFGVVGIVHAGGASVLHLPIEGVTATNSDQCTELLQEKFAPVLLAWKDEAVKIVKDGSTNMVQLRPERGPISLGDVEKALKGSPFSINRDQLEYFSMLRLRIGKIESHEKHVEALATLDGKTLQKRSVENEDGSVWITLRDPIRNKAITLAEKRKQVIITHERLTEYCSENDIKLIEISWGNIHRRMPSGRSYAEVWRGNSYGARPDRAEKDKHVEK
jgi:hypothetical protein